MSDILVKDCLDFVPLQDGTLKGDMKYCNLSLQCRQVGMVSDWYNYFDHTTGEYCFDYFCTGKYVKDKVEDREVS
jgi:hypothetical protein